LNCNNGNTTISRVVDHIDHIKNVSSINNVGFGSDFDGVNGQLPIGLEDVSKFPYLTAELFRRGYSDEDVIKIIGGNFLRVFKEVELTATNLLNQGPLEDLIPSNFVANDTCRTNWLT